MVTTEERERCKLLYDELSGWTLEELTREKDLLLQSATRLDREMESNNRRTNVLCEVLRDRLRAMADGHSCAVRVGSNKVAMLDHHGNVQVRTLIREPGPEAAGGGAA